MILIFISKFSSGLLTLKKNWVDTIRDSEGSNTNRIFYHALGCVSWKLFCIL